MHLSIFMFYASGILGLAFLGRLLPRLPLFDAISADGFFHLAMAERIRSNGLRIPDTVRNISLKHRYDYPFFYHWLLALFPERGMRWAKVLTAPIAYTGVTACALAFSRSLYSVYLPGRETELSLWTALLVALAPPLILTGNHSKSFSGSPRPLGQFLFSIFLCSQLAISLGWQPFLWFGVSVVVVAVTCVTSKFTNQVLFFFGIILLFFGNWEPMTALLSGVILSSLFSGMRTLKVLRGQIMHSYFYYTRLQHRYLYPLRKPFAYVKRATGEMLCFFKNPAGPFIWFFSEGFLPHMLLTTYPHLLIVGFFWLHGCKAFVAGNSAQPAIMALIPWLFAGVLCMVFTSTKLLMFLGDPERYMEHTIIPQFCLFVLVAAETGISWLLPAMLIYSGFFYLIHIAVYRKSMRNRTEIVKTLPELIKNIDREDTVLYGIGNLSWPLLYATKKASIISSGVNIDPYYTNLEEWEEVWGNCSYPGIKIMELIPKYKITYLVGTDTSIEEYEKTLKDDAFSSGKFETLATSGDFKLMRLKS
ncbi:MAG: hypothetical protein A2X49_16140 [Lentisphaerae bacterium GWF2_52_8]|nr:MAG: hypothetical protein A2X49_16140 [Lentisphaerae bacterium GWF2_52_8]